MTAITLILTDAGLAALTNPAHTGTAALTISHIGLSQKHAGNVAAQQALTALPGEFKRLATFGGEVLPPRTIHVFLRDETADAYSLRAFGLYASTGVLLAVVSSETPIMEKAPAATLLQAVDLAFARDIDAELVFGDTNFVNPPATTSRLGVVELATGAETVAGERHDLAVTPWGLAQALLSWAQSFATKSHRHLISEIDGLSDALAAKANRNHTHGADDVNSGVFHVDRIPKLAIGWITGLTDQLAGLAAKVHQHPASDINSGQLHLDRVPLLPLSKVNGLVSALAEKASALHSHTMAQVSGLIDALAAKAPLNSPIFSGVVEAPQLFINASASVARRIVLRTAGASRWTLGATGSVEAGDNAGSNFSIDRYSDTGSYLGAAFSINRATGQATLSTRPNFGTATPWDSANFDPAAKANLSGAVFTGLLGVSRRGGAASLEIDGDPGQVRRIVWQTGGVARWILQADETPESGGNVGSDLILMNRGDTGGSLGVSLRIKRETGVYQFARRPNWSGLTPWDTGNFDPATKVDHQARHIADFNAAPDSAGLSVIHAGEVPNGAPGAWSQGLQFGRARERIVQLLFDDREHPGVYVRKSFGTPASVSWSDTVKLWHSRNFDPDAKANLASPALTGNPTAPTQAAGNNSTRIATTAFVRQEVNTAIEPLATTAAMNAADALKAPLASPAFTGTPTAPTQTAGNNSTRIATTAFVRQELNTAIEPLASTAAMNAADALKAPLASPALTGNPTAPTQPSGNNSTRLATTAFVQSALTSAVSAGAVSYFARATAPAGWLAANGAAVSRTTYADLFAAIGTTFGAGNGSTTFNLPDLRGEFVRGLDDGRGIDAGRSLGSAHASQNLAHTHEYAEIMGVDNTQAGAGIQGGWFSYGATTSSSGGGEARPRNIALLACIKF